MNQTETEIEPTMKESQPVDDALRVLWEKVKEASELIAELKHQRQQLQIHVDSLQNELTSIRSDMTEKEQEIKRLKAEVAHSTNTNGTAAFSAEEREILKNRIRELIATINSHL